MGMALVAIARDRSDEVVQLAVDGHRTRRRWSRSSSTSAPCGAWPPARPQPRSQPRAALGAPPDEDAGRDGAAGIAHARSPGAHSRISSIAIVFKPRSALPLPLRQVVVLTLEGLSHREAADVVGIRENTDFASGAFQVGSPAVLLATLT
jgi:DNA-directed RNA polymerase specialized sigma24 family protein